MEIVLHLQIGLKLNPKDQSFNMHVYFHSASSLLLSQTSFEGKIKFKKLLIVESMNEYIHIYSFLVLIACLNLLNLRLLSVIYQGNVFTSPFSLFFKKIFLLFSG